MKYKIVKKWGENEVKIGWKKIQVQLSAMNSKVHV